MAQDTSVGSNLELQLIVYLPNGHTVPVTCKGSDKLSSVREKCWNKEKAGFQGNKNDGRFRLYTTLYYFNDNDPVSDLILVYPCFEGLGSVRRYSIMLEAPQDVGDQNMRSQMKADAKKPLLWQGYLLKCSKPTGKGFWQKRYFVIQSNTLLWYSNQEAFLKGTKAQKFLQIGGVIPRIDHPVCLSTKQKNPMALEIPQHYGHSKGTYILASESEHLRGTFIETMSKMAYFRQCVTVLTTLPHIRPYVEVEGIFRLAGNSTKIQQLQQSIDFGLMPDFSKVCQTGNPEDLHTMTGLFKRNLRFMQPPVVPPSLYENFIQIGRLLDVAQRVEKLQVLVLQLPYRSLYIMSKLFPFLKFAAKRAAKSRMDAENLAIVIGPNVLRTNIDNPLKAMDDNDHIKAVVCTMIQYSDKIFPVDSILLDIDKQSPNFNDGLAGSTSNQHGAIHGREISFGGGIFDLTNKIAGNANPAHNALSATNDHSSKKEKRKSTGNLKFGLGRVKNKLKKSNKAQAQVQIQHQQQAPPQMSQSPPQGYSQSQSGQVQAPPSFSQMSPGMGSMGYQAPGVGGSSTGSGSVPMNGQGQQGQQVQSQPGGSGQSQVRVSIGSNSSRGASRSIQVGGGGVIIPTLSDLNPTRLRKTSKDNRPSPESPKEKSPVNVDFRSGLKKTNRKFDGLENKNKNYGQHKVDFRAHLKKSGKTPKKDDSGNFKFGDAGNNGNAVLSSNSSNHSNSSVSLPPKVLQEQLSNKSEPPMRSGFNNNQSKVDFKKKQLADLSPLQPPPPPAHVADEFKKQQENDQVSRVCQEFQDNMGEIDEEIDLLQDYAQDLFSHLMEMANQGSIDDARDVAKRVEQNCHNVIKAARMQRDALTEFNKYLETFLQELNPNVTPGGPTGGSHGYQNSGGITGLGQFQSFMSEQKSDFGNNSIYQQVSIINDGALDSFSSGLPMNPNANNNINAMASQMNNVSEEKEDSGGISGLPKFANNNSYNNNNNNNNNPGMINSSPSDVNVIQKEATNVGNEGYSAAQSPNALYVVKASYDYPGGYRTQELTFSRGMVLLVTAEAEGWLFGCYESDISKHGWFPESYVHKM